MISGIWNYRSRILNQKCTDKPIWNLLYSMNANYSASKRKLNKRAIDNLCKQENLSSLRPTVVTEACKVKRTPDERNCSPTPNLQQHQNYIYEN